MTIDERIRAALHHHIAEHHDQLIESVFQYYDDSYIAGDEEDGQYIHTQVRVSYVVNPDIEPRLGIPNLRYFWYQGDMCGLIHTLDEGEM